jgi:Tn3 transposase DDE domain
MLSLHLLQVSLVYVNTLMIQQVLKEGEWRGRLTAADLRALSPLKWQHINRQSLWNLRPQYERAPDIIVDHGLPRRYFAEISNFARLRPI